MTRADGSLTASWPAVSGATSYHVTYSSTGGSSWELAALNHTGTSITFGVDNAKTYIVGVRAKNGNGGGGWRNSPSAGPYTPPTPDPTPTPTPTPAPPDAVASVSVTRADGTLTASWDAPSGATSYHVTYTDDGAQSWQLAAIDHTSTSIVISADNTKTYVVGVRAKNAQGGSNWRNSPAAGPFTPPTPDPTPTPTPTPAPPDAVASVSVTRADASLTASWDAPSGATSYHVTYTDDGAQSWQLAALDHTETSITITADNAKTYIVGVRAKNASGGSNWRNSASAGPFTPSPTLTAVEHFPDQSSVGAQAQSQTIDPDPQWSWVKLTLSGHTGNWWYKANVGPHTACSTNAVTGATIILSGLTAGTTYTYTAYSDSTCSTALDSATFTTITKPTITLSAVTIKPTYAILEISGWDDQWWYKGQYFDTNCTGPVEADATATTSTLPVPRDLYNYTAYGAAGCDSAYELDDIGIQTPFPTLSITALSSNGAGLRLNDWPVANPWYYKVTASPSDPNLDTTCQTKTSGQNDYDVSLSNLQANTTYTVRIFRGGGVITSCHAQYKLDTNSSLFQFITPELTVVPGPLSASLSLSHWSGQWWYRAVGIYSPTTGNFVGYTGKACRGPAQGSATAVLTGLESDYTWAFKAYNNHADCDADYHYANANADDSRATGVLSAVPVKAKPLATSLYIGRHRSDSAAETHVLTLHPWGANNAAWYYRVTAVNPGSGIVEGACTGPVNGASATIASRPPLSDNSSYYLYSAHLRSDCQMDIDLVADSSPVALSLTKAGTSATLSIANWSGNWWYSADTGPHTTCQGPVSGTSATLTGLTVGTRYTYTAHGDSACSSAPATYAFTAADAPPGAVTNLFLQNWNRVITWSAPTERGTGGSLTYDIECIKQNTSTWHRAQSGYTTTSYGFQSDCGFYPSKFRVRAKSGADGPWVEIAGF